MKPSELRKLIREEVRKHLDENQINESNLTNLPAISGRKKLGKAVKELDNFLTTSGVYTLPNFDTKKFSALVYNIIWQTRNER
jgi:hypothetical protein